MGKLPKHFVDTWVFYESDEDPGMWVAHSLNTDQIAMGKCVLEAFVALKRVMRVLLAAANKDPRLEVLCPAPAEIRALAGKAKPLSRDLLDRAEELLRRRGRKPPYGGRFKRLRAPVDLEFAAT